MQEVHKSVYEDHSKVYVELVAISWHELLIHWKYCFDKATLKKAWYISLVLFTLAMDVFYSYSDCLWAKKGEIVHSILESILLLILWDQNTSKELLWLKCSCLWSFLSDSLQSFEDMSILIKTFLKFCTTKKIVKKISRKSRVFEFGS